MFNSILRTPEAVTSTQAVALREVRKVYGRATDRSSLSTGPRSASRADHSQL